MFFNSCFIEPWYRTVVEKGGIAPLRIKFERHSSRNGAAASPDGEGSLTGVGQAGVTGVGTADVICLPNPQATMDVILDTGSADLWLSSTYCDNIGCVKGAQYDERSSTTAEKVQGDRWDTVDHTEQLVVCSHREGASSRIEY